VYLAAQVAEIAMLKRQLARMAQIADEQAALRAHRNWPGTDAAPFAARRQMRYATFHSVEITVTYVTRMYQFNSEHRWAA